MNVVLPGSAIGLVGGGQLGRMFALEARRMGYRTVVLDPGSNPPAAQVSDEHIRAELTDLDAARDLADRCDVVTLEWENADLEAVRTLGMTIPVRPGAHVLEIAQNRLLEKEAAGRLGLRTAEFARVVALRDLHEGVERLGTPAILKTATGGYDGRGQRVIRSADEVSAAYAELGDGTRELILEAWVPFRIEASVICARGPDGSVASFPVVENRHHRGILDFTLAPAEVSRSVEREALEIGETLVRGLDVVGLLAIELFIDHDDRLYVNEIAPRPHNSGHYTWEACNVSQFEQQLRAVCGLPLADPLLLRPAAMANLLGEHVGTGARLPTIVDALRTPSLSLHLYGKRDARAGRKMGHLTALAESAADAFERVAEAREALTAGAVHSTDSRSADDTRQ